MGQYPLAMRVITNSPDLLIVEERPWLIGVFMITGTLAFAGSGLAILLQGQLAGLLFLGGSAIWMLFFFVFVRRVQVVFNGSKGWLEIRRRSLLGYSKVRHELSEIDRAIYQVSSGDGSDTYRITLIVPRGQSAGKHPLTEYYSGFAGTKQVVQVINSWLDSYRQRT